MNRRDFAKSLAALGLAPALPTISVAATPAYTPYMYGLGAHLARAKGRCSPDMLMQKLRLTPQAARAMQAQLIRSGVISAPVATGIASAVQPYMRGVIARPAGGLAMTEAAKNIADLSPEQASPEASSTSRDPYPSPNNSEI